MNKIQQKTNDQLRTQDLGTDERTDKGIPVYPPLCEWGYNYIYGGGTGFRSPNIVCLTIRPSAHLVYATSHLSLVAFYSYLVSWLAMIWVCAYYTDFTDGWFLRALYPFSCLFDHMSDGKPRYQLWIKCDQRQMTSCIHKICGRTYGQTNMKRALTLAKINHPWNRYNMHMLRSWPPFAHLVYATSHLSFVAFYSYLVSGLAMIWACAYYTDFTDGLFLREL
jgi:hypothetical protein